ncbi:efflux transporter outer membrane subunit [Cupriavidus sp. CP313]
MIAQLTQLTNPLSRVATLATALILAGCSLAPTYKVPETATTAGFKEAEAAQTEGVLWKTATPADGQARGEWWKVFGDEALNKLIDAANANNQDLAAAAARVEQARAFTGATEADLYPHLSLGVDPTRTQYSNASVGYLGGSTPPVQTLIRARGIASYELDLFGRVASSVNAARADDEAARKMFRSVQLALQADVAQAYFQLRTLDSDRDILNATIKLREEALTLMRKRFESGQTTDFDPARAEAEFGTARSELAATERHRANQEHALAVLTGLPPAAFTLSAKALKPTPLSIPAGMPSELLERRPDIAQAERRMAAANARIGVARAAFFPRISLSAFLGFESSNFADLFKYSSRAWAVGPLVGSTIAQTVFDGGRNSANLTGARAAHEESVAAYRQTVLTAFREVEDSLADVRWLSQQSTALDSAIAGTKRAQRISRSLYDAGAADYLTVIDADRTVLQSQRDANTVAGLRASATVSLVRSLGGGWGPLPETSADNGVSRAVTLVGTD